MWYSMIGVAHTDGGLFDVLFYLLSDLGPFPRISSLTCREN